jgi:ATP-dependent DNA helicase HFM1/MER3
MRIIAVSATLPNISEIAEFLTANEAYVFDESFRPVPLKTHVIGLGNAGENGSNQYRFWSGLDREVAPLIQRFSDDRPTIVFCHSKADTERLADLLATTPGIAKDGNADIASKTRLQRLQRTLLAAIAYHHAGMEVDDRRLVENSFASSKIRVLCATSTLAMGVNLPARLVIVKGTRAWRGGTNGYQDLDQASLLQMIGRAGRQGYDTTGTAVIMTESKSKAKFEQLASTGLQPARSQLLSTFQEIVNAAISQRVIIDMSSALNWIKGTLYFTQVKRDPAAHSLRVVSDHSIDTHLLGLLRECFRKLQQVGAAGIREGSALQPFDACHIMSQHMVDYETLRIFSTLPYDVSQSDVLKAICHIERLQRPVKRSEKRTLNAAHKQLRHKLDGPLSKARVKEPWEKAFVLLQASIGRMSLEDFTLRHETSGMVDFASRMLTAAEEFGARSSKNGKVVVQSLKLRRALATSLWCGRDGVLGQFSSLSDHTVSSLKFNGISTFEDVLGASESALEKAAKRMAPFGASLRDAVGKVIAGKLKVEAKVINQTGTRIPLAVECHLQPWQPSPDMGPAAVGPSTDSSQVIYTMVAYTDRPNGCLVYKRNVTKPESVKFACPPKFGRITIHLIASMVGLDGEYISQQRLKVLQRFSPPTYSCLQTHLSSMETMSRSDHFNQQKPRKPGRKKHRQRSRRMGKQK